jgi:2-C-methyl-D-erythritol 4-phosphate cytidylyltransferase
MGEERADVREWAAGGRNAAGSGAAPSGALTPSTTPGSGAEDATGGCVADDVQRERLTLALVIAGAGYGTRMGSEQPKQYVPLLGIPMLQRTIGALNDCSAVDALVVVVNPEHVEYCERQIIGELFDKVIAVVPGGAERALSVRSGLQELAAAGVWDLMGVHDGARPLITCDEVTRAVATLVDDAALDGVVLGVPSKDTIKVVDEQDVVRTTPSRGRLWCAQTPQIFRREALLGAYATAEEVLLAATDDASLVERAGGRVGMVRASAENLKVTDRVDLRLAEQILADRRA